MAGQLCFLAVISLIAYASQPSAEEKFAKKCVMEYLFNKKTPVTDECKVHIDAKYVCSSEYYKPFGEGSYYSGECQEKRAEEKLIREYIRALTY